jgi:predicted nucleotidyltransferase
MNNTFGPWQHPIEESKLEVPRTVSGVARARNVPFMVFGAFARELHFYHRYGIPCPRRTNDVDFGLQLADWDAYRLFRDGMKEKDFDSENPDHPEKLVHGKSGQEIDLLPFGEIEEEGKQIKWPSDNSPWSVLGFEEAFEHAWTFRLEKDDIRVVSLPMLVVLKIVAVMDRETVRHKKDGTDIAFILEHYLDAGNRHRLLEDPDRDLMAACDNDLDAATAQLLGRDMNRAMRPNTRTGIRAYLRRQVESRGRCHLVHGLMESSRFATFPVARACLHHLLTGLEKDD